MKFLSITATRLSHALLSAAGRGGSLPGTIGTKLDPDILKKLSFNGPVVLVTGTNGKTSTANMITDLFIKAGYKTISNRKGDNLKAGIVTTLLTNATTAGKIKADAVVLEVDELNVRHILPYLPVSAFVVNNFFRDQLDRAREMEQLIATIENVLPDYKGTLILNGNDPNVVRLADKAPFAKDIYFGIGKSQYSKTNTNEASEGKFCPRCGAPLHYKFYQYSHIGSFYCTNCDFKTPSLNVELKNINLDTMEFDYDHQVFKDPYEGMYSMYNCTAVIAAAKAFHIDLKYVHEVFASAPQPQGRNERFEHNGKNIVLNLIKNPTGANEVMKVIEKNLDDKNIVIVLNDREQDGTDVSWIYDTFFEKLMNEKTKSIICTGTRANDMALRLYYGGYKGDLKTIESLDAAIDEGMDLADDLYVIATYTALQPSRNEIVKRLK